MENKISESQKKSLVNILTLRYDPSIKPNLVPKQPDDFNTNSSFIDTSEIENSICDEMNSHLSTNDSAISIALSGGVDSTLVLALLRKTKPTKKIHAISIKFANSAATLKCKFFGGRDGFPNRQQVDQFLMEYK